MCCNSARNGAIVRLYAARGGPEERERERERERVDVILYRTRGSHAMPLWHNMCSSTYRVLYCTQHSVLYLRLPSIRTRWDAMRIQMMVQSPAMNPIPCVVGSPQSDI